MNDELEELKAELEEVKSSNLEYLPNYGYSSKKELIELIEEDISELEAKIAKSQFSYTVEELELERTQLCISLGISRYC